MIRQSRLRAITHPSKGASLTEYAILLTLLGAVAIPAVLVLGGEVQTTLTDSNEVISIAEGIGSGEYANFEEGEYIRDIDQNECLVTTQNADTLNQTDLAEWGCVHTLGGNDAVTLGSLAPMLVHPGAGDDFITGIGSDVTIVYMEGDDTYFQSGANTTVRFPDLSWNDITMSPTDLDTNANSKGWNSFIFNTPNGTVTFTNGMLAESNSALERAEFSDLTQISQTLIQAALDSQIDSSNNTIYGTAYADTLVDQGGDDTVYTGEGNDLWRWTGGNDFIDFDKGLDTLEIIGYTFADVSLSINRRDLHLTAGGDTIRLRDGARYQLGDSNFVINSFIFADQTLDMATIAPLFVNAQIAAGEQRVEGTGYNDIIAPTAANEILSPAGGDDTIIYDTGNFRIHGDVDGFQLNTGFDTLDLSKYTSSQVTVTNDNGTAVLTTPDGQIRIEFQFAFANGAHPHLSIDLIEFSDTTWDESALRSAAGL